MHKTRDERKRFEMLSKLTSNHSSIELTEEHIRLIKQSKLIAVYEKIELFAVSLGYKLISEVDSSIDYQWDDATETEIPMTQDLLDIKKLLDQLPFPYFLDSITKFSRKSSKQRKITWFQVCLNQNLAEFVREFHTDMTSMEIGILYGYPSTSIAAYSGLIEMEHKNNITLAHRYLGSLLSTRFREQELAWYQKAWDEIDAKYSIMELIEEQN